MTKRCPQCGKEFTTYQCKVIVGKGKFCSKRCYGDSLIKPKYCDYCGKELVGSQKVNKFCSKECKMNGSYGEFIRSERCGLMTGYHRRGKRCPKMSRENNPNWKGGITKISTMIRNSTRYIEWRKKVMHRDDYTCQLCGKRGVYLQVDHYPITFSQIMLNNQIMSVYDGYDCGELWYDSNARTLCIDCHKSTPSYLNKYFALRKFIEGK